MVTEPKMLAATSRAASAKARAAQAETGDEGGDVLPAVFDDDDDAAENDEDLEGAIRVMETRRSS